jgi:glycosyltransferase involved in cell wall biosynthesis
MPIKFVADLDSGISQTKGTRKKFLFVASDITQPLKGLNLLMEAMNYFCDSVTLNIVGAGNIELSSESQKYVNLLGNLTEKELQKQFDTCDALIVPSLSENRPNVIIEAQLSGVFVLATDVGGIPEMVLEGQTGILFRPNKDKLVEAITKYLEMTEENKLDIIGRALTRARESNNPSKIIRAHINLYVELMNEYRLGDSGARQR